MTATFGRKQLSLNDRSKFFRSTPRLAKRYGRKEGNIKNEYQQLLESFTSQDYQLYETLLNAHKRVASLLNYCKTNNVQGPVLELAIIRSQDLHAHQRLVQVLRYMWTDLGVARKAAVNADPNKFWNGMAIKIQQRCISENHELHPEWQGVEGRLVLVQFLKDLYKKQLGKCAISNVEMTLTIGTKKSNKNKCSPDRKSSNKGYTPNNLWLVTWWVNTMKMDLSIVEFWKKVDILAESRQGRRKLLINKR